MPSTTPTAATSASAPGCSRGRARPGWEGDPPRPPPVGSCGVCRPGRGRTPGLVGCLWHGRAGAPSRLPPGSVDVPERFQARGDLVLLAGRVHVVLVLVGALGGLRLGGRAVSRHARTFPRWPGGAGRPNRDWSVGATS